jgi:hypothetical protein
VENFSDTPAVAPTLYVEADTDNMTLGDGKSVVFSLPLRDIPPCSSATVNIGPVASGVLRLPQAALKTSDVNVYAMTFTDSSGLYWEYAEGSDKSGNTQSQLLQIVTPPFSKETAYIASVSDASYKPASGCG